MSKQAYEDNLESIFVAFDKNQQGFLDIDTFSEALEFLQLKFDTDQVDELFFAFDPHETGRITYSNFVEFCSADHVDENCKAVRQAIVLYVSDFHSHYTDTDDELETMATDDLLSSEFIETPGIENVREGMVIEVMKNGIWQTARVAEEIFDEAGSVLVTEVDKQVLIVRNVPERVRPIVEVGGDETPESGAEEYIREEYDISDDDGHLEVQRGGVAEILNAFEDDMYAFEVEMIDGRYPEESTTQSWEEDEIAVMNSHINQQISVEGMTRFQELQEPKRRKRNAKSVRFHPDVVEDHRPSLPKEKWVRNDKINSKRRLLQHLVNTTPTEVKKQLENLNRRTKKVRDREQVNILRKVGEDVPSSGRQPRKGNNPPSKQSRRITQPQQQPHVTSSRRTKDVRRPFVRKASPIKVRKSETIQPKSILKREVILGVPPKSRPASDALIMGKPAAHMRRSSPIKRRAPSPLRKQSPPSKKPAPNASTKRIVTATENKLVISRIFDDSSPERPHTERRRKEMKASRDRKTRIVTTNDDRKIVDSSDLVDDDDEKVSEIILSRARAMNNEDLWQDRALSDSSINRYNPNWRSEKRNSLDQDSIAKEVQDILSQRKRILNEEQLLKSLQIHASKNHKTYSDSSGSESRRSSSSHSFERTSKRRKNNDLFTGSKAQTRRKYNRSVPTLSLSQIHPKTPLEPVYIPVPKVKRVNGAKPSRKGASARNEDQAVKRKNGAGVRRRQVDPPRTKQTDDFRRKLQEHRFEEFLRRKR